MNRSEHDPIAAESIVVRPPSRRELLGTAITLAAACVLCCPAGGLFAAPPTNGPAGEFDAGPVSAFAADGVYDVHVTAHKVLILRSGKQLIAASAVCPHRNKLVQKTGKADPAILCPAHDSTFDASGVVLNGPAKTSLPRFAVRLDKGHLFVEPGQSFEEHDWNDPRASATVA